MMSSEPSSLRETFLHDNYINRSIEREDVREMFPESFDTKKIMKTFIKYLKHPKSGFRPIINVRDVMRKNTSRVLINQIENPIEEKSIRGISVSLDRDSNTIEKHLLEPGYYRLVLHPELLASIMNYEMSKLSPNHELDTSPPLYFIIKCFRGRSRESFHISILVLANGHVYSFGYGAIMDDKSTILGRGILMTPDYLVNIEQYKYDIVDVGIFNSEHARRIEALYLSQTMQVVLLLKSLHRRIRFDHFEIILHQTYSLLSSDQSSCQRHNYLNCTSFAESIFNNDSSCIEDDSESKRRINCDYAYVAKPAYCSRIGNYKPYTLEDYRDIFFYYANGRYKELHQMIGCQERTWRSASSLSYRSKSRRSSSKHTGGLYRKIRIQNLRSKTRKCKNKTVQKYT